MKQRLLTILSILTLAFGGLTGCSPAPDASENTQSASFELQPEAGSEQELLNIHFLDIGQGDCAILTQGDHAMLVDAGENDKGTQIQAYLNYLDIDRLDYAVLTHPDADHIGGADVVLYKFDCDTILMPDRKTDTRTYDDVIQAMKSKNEAALHPEVGDTFAFGDASFTILSPSRAYDDNNNNSIVFSLTHGDNTFLFTGDAEAEAEADMLKSGLSLKADVLKAGHHGSSTSTTDEFLAAVSPEYAVISCGEGNKYGHPHAETMNKFRENGITVYRTDEQGTIVAASDGKTITWNMSPSDSWVTGEATGSANEEAPASYILNTNTLKFHLPSCKSAEDILPENREDSSKSRDELLKEGYSPCGRCKP